MSNFNEEEIIDIVKEIKRHQVAFYEPKEHKQIVKYYFTQEQRDAIQGLLDLYNKEKGLNNELQIRYKIENDKYLEEKEKNIQDMIKDIECSNFIKDNYISKNKIKELAKKYEYASVGYDSSTADYKQSQDIGRYIAYVELFKGE